MSRARVARYWPEVKIVSTMRCWATVESYCYRVHLNDAWCRNRGRSGEVREDEEMIWLKIAKPARH